MAWEMAVGKSVLFTFPDTILNLLRMTNTLSLTHLDGTDWRLCLREKPKAEIWHFFVSLHTCNFDLLHFARCY